MARALIVLAGTSESGKSSAGAHFARDHRARRIKIRSILAELTGGNRAGSAGRRHHRERRVHGEPGPVVFAR
jgi:hypothetical protein